MSEATRVRFGIFDFDPETLELRREGVPARLQSQPAQVLGLLLSHAGEVVTRETLRQAIWGEGVFVDFDRGLNFCIAQIRSALGDSAESPRFVRTLPKRGYQFIAPVIPAAAAPDVSDAPPPLNAPSRSRLTTRGWALAALAIIIAAGIVWWHPWNPARSPVRVAVARFDNETGNPELDRFTDGLTDSVVAELTAAADRRYGVIGNAAILRGPRAQRDLRAIASSLGATYVVIGQVQRDSSRVRVLAHLIRLPEQTHLDVARFELEATDRLSIETDLAQQIASRFSRRIASSHATVSD